jgi:hypothetical protein
VQALHPANDRVAPPPDSFIALINELGCFPGNRFRVGSGNRVLESLVRYPWQMSRQRNPAPRGSRTDDWMAIRLLQPQTLTFLM